MAESQDERLIPRIAVIDMRNLVSGNGYQLRSFATCNSPVENAISAFLPNTDEMANAFISALG